MEGKEKIKMCVSMWGRDREHRAVERKKRGRGKRRREGIMEMLDKFFNCGGFLVKKNMECRL